MKSLIRWGAILSLVGTSWLGSSFLGNQQALALSQAQIVEKLRAVPVFTITDAEGAPLVASVPGENGDETASVAGVFMSQQDAQAFLTELRGNNPQLAQNVQVVPVSLAEVYELDRSSPGEEDLQFAYVPVAQQVESAMQLLREQGQQVQQFNGVPLFLATAGPERGYLTLEQGDQQVIPLFFTKEDLEVMLERFQQQQPDLANSVEIQVVNLEGVLQALESSDEPQMNQIMLIPPRESLEFLESQPQGAGQNQ